MAILTKIVKRNGRVVDFNPEKIATAIFKAAQAVGSPDMGLAQSLATKVIATAESRFGTEKTPSVEDMQDIVEETLISSGEAKIAKAYILYRQKRTELRNLKKAILQGQTDEEVDLSLNALKVLEKRFLKKDADGKLLETPSQMFRRVAANIAQADAFYGGDVAATTERFYERMRKLELLPSTPTLMNAGTSVQQLVASFVLPVEDSIESIFDALKHAAMIHKTGGGTGFSFSKLRPKHDIIVTSQGQSTGPTAFMRLFDASTNIIKEGGAQRGANIGILRVDHPDILEFINLKADGKSFTNFNLSVGVTDTFMEAVLNDREYQIINPRTRQPVTTLSARGVFDNIIALAWQRGDPGLIFIDRINQHNPLLALGEIEATDPCGDQPLLPYESAPLAAINLLSCVKQGDMNWEKLKELVHDAVHMLDNVIDVNKYPLQEIERASKATRKIGVGIMGFADTLYHIGVPYDSESGLEWCEKIMKFIKEEAVAKSMELAEQRGTFPSWAESTFSQRGLPLRNAGLITIAPTGTISMIADVSPSIEPNFAISFVKNVMGDTDLVYVNKVFSKVAKKRNFYSDQLIREIADKGGIQHIPEIPDDVKRVFVTAQEIMPEWHIRMQAAFQKHVDNAISKTINFPADASLQEVSQGFILAYKLGCKGLTVYRDKSLDQQVIQVSHAKRFDQKEEQKGQNPFLRCSECGASLQFSQGKGLCQVCGTELLQ
ncbi:MAG: adenosylcobalamin-dependent ribonucleoside-diphosphate reductase [Candidatus Woesearchaeota archaeon]